MLSLYHPKIKEDNKMKTAVQATQNFMSRPVVPYPNAVSRREFFHKILDTVLIAASGIGITVMLVFLLMTL